MSQQFHLEENIQHILATLDEQGNQDEARAPYEEVEIKTIHVYPVEGGGILLTREPLEEDETIDTAAFEPQDVEQQPRPPIGQTTPTAQERPLFPGFLFILCLFLLLDMANTALVALLTPTVTITVVPVIKTVAITGELDGAAIGARITPPLTLSESQAALATGHRHQDATRATGFITFYNGQFSEQTVAAGTVLTTGDGVQIAIDSGADIPAANPPGLGQVSVSAHAVQSGARGDISALGIDEPCCLPAVFAKNLSPFSGGQDARDFTVVTSADIQSVVTPLTRQLMQSEQAALSAHLSAGEALDAPTCTQAISSDHRPGDEAARAKVTVSEMCSAVAYGTNALQEAAARLLAAASSGRLGPHYHQVGTVRTVIDRLTMNGTHPGSITLAVRIEGTYVYQLTQQEQRQLVERIAGQRKQAALYMLRSLPGVRAASITGIQDNTFLPDDPSRIRLLFLY
ncbi:MAG TPA: hypothetical protein VKV40_20150 [Ktedonobacteraceae bacterium]|nr:hypothetical protein [Ktedonobacteraceae bacterium]